ncbi:MAG: hypothetical protein OXC99_09325 [Chloroflexi bacterium]|nr:hypothetical protein [Chloroflexota bacterium]
MPPLIELVRGQIPQGLVGPGGLIDPVPGSQGVSQPAQVCGLPRTWMQGSQGEVLCWIAAAGACDHLNMELLEYIPGYRSPAGTGCGLAFARWR